ncbi:MAG: hypothetical protein ACN0LA_13480, partial [Candidatus Longimicrobiales bacterium M2_2A_002]
MPCASHPCRPAGCTRAASTPRARRTCWGDDRYGQLGDGTTQPAATPVEVWFPANAKAISAGSFHTCAITIRE